MALHVVLDPPLPFLGITKMGYKRHFHDSDYSNRYPRFSQFGLSSGCSMASLAEGSFSLHSPRQRITETVPDVCTLDLLSPN